VSQAQRVEQAQLHARIQQPPAIGARESQGAEGIEHQAHAHAAARGPRERLDETRSDGARADQVHLQQHVAARGIDRLQHAREEVPAIVEQPEFVPRPPRPARGCKLIGIPAGRHERTMTDPRTRCQILLLSALLCRLGAPGPAGAASGAGRRRYHSVIAASPNAELRYCRTWQTVPLYQPKITGALSAATRRTIQPSVWVKESHSRWVHTPRMIDTPARAHSSGRRLNGASATRHSQR